jgi:hypothetical protein
MVCLISYQSGFWKDYSRAIDKRLISTLGLIDLFTAPAFNLLLVSHDLLLVSHDLLERAYAACPSHDVKLVMEDANAKVGRWTPHQPDQSLLDRRKTFFSRHSCWNGAEGCKHRFRPNASHYKIESKNMPCQQQLRRFAVDRLKDGDVASRYYDELESELPMCASSTTSLG